MNGPLNVQCGVIPCDTTFVFRGVKLRRLVEEIRVATEAQKAVCKSRGNPQLSLIRIAQFDTDPFTIGLGSKTQIHSNIKDGSPGYSNQFALRLLHLVVQTPHYIFTGQTVVVLLKRDVANYGVEFPLIKALVKEPRSSANTRGSKIRTSGIFVGIIFIGQAPRPF